jgi:hypothetical protein
MHLHFSCFYLNSFISLEQITIGENILIHKNLSPTREVANKNKYYYK